MARGASSVFYKYSSSIGYWGLRAFPRERKRSGGGRALPAALLRWTLASGIAALAAGGLASRAFGAAPPETLLTCTNLVSGVAWRIRINFEKSTVDSNPARIDAATISWQDRTDGGHYTLDRGSGRLTVIFASSTGGYFIHDRCDRRGFASSVH